MAVTSVFVVYVLIICTRLAQSASLVNNIRHIVDQEKQTTVCRFPHNVQILVEEMNTGVTLSNMLLAKQGQSTTTRVKAAVKTETYCPSNYSVQSGDPIWMSSNCPWLFEQEYLGSDYYPQYIPKAVCRCTNGCIGSTHGERCEKIYLPIHVIRKTDCVEGINTYVVETIETSVGCTCGRPTF